ncbi:hypothetical protein KUTeg_001225 [Tegillarca granosa]|uniref:Uncharacterized protein n=1 Tax=Tegillarca granosa TaxID=220873 RepID=A0ABQ9FVJ1_TEGGR|nr:hypothetical protein KUTeg_001225 [Tegillarca granosa]
MDPDCNCEMLLEIIWKANHESLHDSDSILTKVYLYNFLEKTYDKQISRYVFSRIPVSSQDSTHVKSRKDIVQYNQKEIDLIFSNPQPKISIKSADDTSIWLSDMGYENQSLTSMTSDHDYACPIPGKLTKAGSEKKRPLNKLQQSRANSVQNDSDTVSELIIRLHGNDIWRITYNRLHRTCKDFIILPYMLNQSFIAEYPITIPAFVSMGNS